MRTGMQALGKILSYFLTASAALLARPTGIDLHHGSAGLFSLVLQDAQKPAPAGIRDRAGQPAVLEHIGDAQAFRRDEPIAMNKSFRNLVMMLPPQIPDSCVDPADLPAGLGPVLPALLLPGDGALRAPQGREFLLQVARVFLEPAFGVGEEPFEAYIDSGLRKRALGDQDLPEIAGEDGVPVVSLVLERDGLDLALNRAVQLDLDATDMLDPQSVPKEADAVPVGREFDRFVAVAGLESRIPRLLPALDSPEEVLEGLLKAAERGLGAREVRPGEELIGLPFFLVPGRLVPVVDGLLLLLPGVLPLGERGVIEPPVGLQHDAQLARLVGVRVQAVLEGPSHLLPLLGLDIGLDGLFADMSDRACIVGAGPETWKPGTKERELLPEHVGRDSLEPIDDFRDAPPRIALDEQVDMVGHDLKGVDVHVHLLRLGAEESPEPATDHAAEDRLAVLGAPYDVVLEGEEGPGVLSVASLHVNEYTIG